MTDLLALAERKELDKLRAYARRASIVLMRFSGGGSEMFEKIGEEYYAEPELCEQRYAHRRDMLVRMTAIRARAALSTPQAAGRRSMTDLLALAERCEGAGADEQRALLELAFIAVHGPKPERVHGGSAEMTAWLHLHNPFFQMLVAGAYLDAALTLVPEGWAWMTGCDFGEGFFASLVVMDEGDTDTPGVDTKAATPALALTAAALRARARVQP